MAAATPCLTTSEERDAYTITHLPIQNISLSAWLQSLREHPALCKKYGIGITATSSHEEESTEDPKDEIQQLDLEDPPPETLAEMRDVGDDAESQLAQIIEVEVRQKTAPVLSH